MKKKSLYNILLRNKKCLLLSGIYAPHTPQSASAASRVPPTLRPQPAGSANVHELALP